LLLSIYFIIMSHSIAIHHNLISLIDEFEGLNERLVKWQKTFLGWSVGVIFASLARIFFFLIYKELVTSLAKVPREINDVDDYTQIKEVLSKLERIERPVSEICKNLEQANRLMVYAFKPFYKIQTLVNVTKLELQFAVGQLDKPQINGANFDAVTEEELWDNRVRVYEYLL